VTISPPKTGPEDVRIFSNSPIHCPILLKFDRFVQGVDLRYYRLHKASTYLNAVLDITCMYEVWFAKS